MSSTFFEFIKRTGIFLICAESILHFAPGNSYQKYIKVLIGIMVLAQFIIPLKAIISGQERAVIEQQIEGFTKVIENRSEEMQLNGLWMNDEESIKNATINEIKLRINNIAADRGYIIVAIDIDNITTITVSRAGDSNESADNDVINNGSANNANASSGTGSPIEIPSIELNGLDQGSAYNNEGSAGSTYNDGGSTYNDTGSTYNDEGSNEELKWLQEEFCNELGTDERYLEVIERGFK
ncbi:MAG: stage III sporulation protein AF [Lachnospiraceae bacterium]|jgi:hypothetical protein|nr:stage III sporulation protein AF [Lachnospiraceae bacterium]